QQPYDRGRAACPGAVVACPRHGGQVSAVVPVQAARVFCCCGTLHAIRAACQTKRPGTSKRSTPLGSMEPCARCADVACRCCPVFGRHTCCAPAGRGHQGQGGKTLVSACPGRKG